MSLELVNFLKKNSQKSRLELPVDIAFIDSENYHNSPTHSKKNVLRRQVDRRSSDSRSRSSKNCVFLFRWDRCDFSWLYDLIRRSQPEVISLKVNRRDARGALVANNRTSCPLIARLDTLLTRVNRATPSRSSCLRNPSFIHVSPPRRGENDHVSSSSELIRRLLIAIYVGWRNLERIAKRADTTSSESWLRENLPRVLVSFVIAWINKLYVYLFQTALFFSTFILDSNDTQEARFPFIGENDVIPRRVGRPIILDYVLRSLRFSEVTFILTARHCQSRNTLVKSRFTGSSSWYRAWRKVCFARWSRAINCLKETLSKRDRHCSIFILVSWKT